MRYTATTNNTIFDNKSGREMGDGKGNTYRARDYVQAQKDAVILNERISN